MMFQDVLQPHAYQRELKPQKLAYKTLAATIRYLNMGFIKAVTRRTMHSSVFYRYPICKEALHTKAAHQIHPFGKKKNSTPTGWKPFHDALRLDIGRVMICFVLGCLTQSLHFII